MIKVGIGGWVFEPWRGVFYPDGLPQKRELEHASRAVTSIEINGTYYGTQKPESFRKWAAETPDDFVFALKGSRYTTNRRVLAEAGESIRRLIDSGITELGDKLGPINWQFMETKAFAPEDFEAFLALLPKTEGSRRLRHAVEVRHDSFKTAEFVALASRYGVAIVLADSDSFPLIRRSDRRLRLCPPAVGLRGGDAGLFRRSPRPLAGPRRALCCGQGAR